VAEANPESEVVKPMNLMLYKLSARMKCDQKGCTNVAAWVVGYSQASQPLCKEHVLECMSDEVFWRAKLRNGLGYEMA